MNELINIYLEREKLKLILCEVNLIKEYQCNVCQKCAGTDKQKKRDCGKLNGFSTLGCECMSSTISKKMKQKNDQVLRKLIFFELLNSQKAV